MKKILFSLLIGLLIFTGCDKKEESIKNDTKKFKEEYESLNGTKNSSGKEIRTITIDEEYPIFYKSEDEIVKMIENKETFVVYFGFASCPWCRSVLPTLISTAKKNGIKEIYYTDVKNIRDTKKVNDNNEIETTKGTDGYMKLLDLIGDVLSDYSLKDKDGNSIDVNEKRIYAPNVVIIKKGIAIDMTTGISDLETDPYMELTDEILSDTKKQFDDLFKKYNDDSCRVGDLC